MDDLDLCEWCGHDIDLHDGIGCQVGMGKRNQCRCRRTAQALRSEIRRELRADNLAVYQCGCINDRRFPRCELHNSPIDRVRTLGMKRLEAE